jgi:hypothetical protein
MTCLVDESPRRVADFIEATSATWDEEKLQQHFLPMDVEAILEIPLSHKRQEDFWSWHHDRRGVFTVRSAYNMLIRTHDRREAWLDGRAASSNESQI